MKTRLIVPIAALALLAGCASQSWLPPNDPDPPPPAMSNDRCVAVARQRADDARQNGYNLEIENSVYAEAYQNCIAQHAPAANQS